MSEEVDFGFSLGQTVNIVPISKTGRIDGIMYMLDGIQYRVVYWSEDRRFSEWVYANELKATHVEKSIQVTGK